MKKQVFNPYLPSWEYIPDGEPHIFDGRVYVYGSHDRFNGELFCMNDYVCWSAPVDDLSDWHFEGVIYRKIQDPDNPGGENVMYAPDVARGPDGRYYLYYGLADDTKIGVAVCDTPAGQYQFLSCVHDKNGNSWGKRPQDFMPFDAGVLVDDDGRIHLYAGQGPLLRRDAAHEYETHFRDSVYYVELEPDMVTMKTEPVRMLPNLMDSAGSGFEHHEFFEASSIRKFDGKYYFIYSSVQMHELCWAVSDRPDGGFRYGGVLTSNADVGTDGCVTYEDCDKILDPSVKNYTGNNHGSVAKIGDDYYVFGHRHTNRHMYSRQAYAEKIEFRDGEFIYTPSTSCGLNGGPLRGVGTYEARIACHLMSEKGCTFSDNDQVQNMDHPCFTQEGVDREDCPNQYIANLRSGAKALYRYFDFDAYRPAEIEVSVRGEAEGWLRIFDDEDQGTELAAVRIGVCAEQWQQFCSEFRAPCGVKPLCFLYEGEGALDFFSFTLK